MMKSHCQPRKPSRPSIVSKAPDIGEPRKLDSGIATMNTATITQAHDKGLRTHVADAFGKIRDFAIELYTAHGGWFVSDAAQPASGALARSKQQSLAHMMILGTACENYAPALAADMVKE